MHVQTTRWGLIRMLLLAALMLPASAVANCRSSAAEPFARFVDAFGRDKAFAVTRTEYPLSLLKHGESDEEEGGRAIVRTRVSKHDDAAMPAMAEFARENGLELSTRSLQKTSAIVRMEKPDTDWLLTYHFVRKGACWYLRRIEDHSL